MCRRDTFRFRFREASCRKVYWYLRDLSLLYRLAGGGGAEGSGGALKVNRCTSPSTQLSRTLTGLIQL